MSAATSASQASGQSVEPTAGVVRLLAGVGPDGPMSVSAHHAVHGPLPEVRTVRRGRERHPLLTEIAAAGLTGRGGAGFPLAQKIRSVIGAPGRPTVVVNVAESEPASLKDAVLATRNPHLVLDGAEVAATLVGANRVIVWSHRGADQVTASLRWAAAQRRPGLRWDVVAGPARYVAGESSAIVGHLSGGAARPTTSPPRVSERGVDGRPTLLSNAETFAQLALVVRHGAAWYRAVGTSDEPGTTLLTLAGAVNRPGVVEVELGTPVGDVVAEYGGLAGPVDAVLVGGYAGSWVTWDRLARQPLSRAGLRHLGVDLGVGMLGFLPADRCGLAETAQLTRWLAGESAGQCGPCLNGLPSLSRAFDHLVDHGDQRTPVLLNRWAKQVSGRGACHHPDGVARLVTTALTVFAREAEQHARHRPCAGCGRPAVFSVPRTVPHPQDEGSFR